MNPFKLNECIELIASKLEDKKPNHPASKIFRKLKTAAAFHMNMPDISPKIDDLPRERIMAGDRLCPPFAFIRLFDAKDDMNGWRHHYLFHYSSERVICADICEMRNLGISASVTESQSSKLHDLVTKGVPAPFGGAIMMLKPSFDVLPQKEEYTGVHQENINKFCEFISIVNCPRHHVCKVSRSNPEKRSVEWVEARSHYIVLGPEHAKEVRAGSTREFTGAITKAMHHRRSHFRKLTHERYTKKRGLQIWVNASWVGPKEWKDRFSNTYKIIERNGKL